LGREDDPKDSIKSVNETTKSGNSRTYLNMSDTMLKAIFYARFHEEKGM